MSQICCRCIVGIGGSRSGKSAQYAMYSRCRLDADDPPELPECDLDWVAGSTRSIALLVPWVAVLFARFCAVPFTALSTSLINPDCPLAESANNRNRNGEIE